MDRTISETAEAAGVSAHTRRYAELVWAGDHTEADRLALLEAHRDRVHAQLAETERCLARIDFKIDVYRERITSA